MTDKYVEMPDWIPEQCDHLTINDNRYYFRCNFANINRKANGMEWTNVQLQLVIFSVKDMAFLDHKDIKGTYVAEKISEYVRNTLNGQRSPYWSNDHERNFDKPKPIIKEKVK